MKLRPFELGLVIIFGALAVFALILFATNDPKDSDPDVIKSEIHIWGTLPLTGVVQVLQELAVDDDGYKKVYYTYWDAEQFDDKLTNALADQVGPDLILVPHEKLVKLRNRIYPIPFQQSEDDVLFLPERDLRDKYIDGASIFSLSDGTYGYPIAVDPLVMYWNKDIFSSEGFLEAPKTWEELVDPVLPRLIDRDFDRTIRRSVVAMGEYKNIRNAFGILSTLFIQGGSARVSEDNGRYNIQLQKSLAGSTDPVQKALDFYTRFSSPSNSLYSWNRSASEDRHQFIAEDLALYFGYGSEGPQLEYSNPNLNFDIAEVPQGATATVRRTYGTFYTLARLRTTRNFVDASVIMYELARPAVAAKIAINSDMVPADRTLVNYGSNDTYGRITYQAAGVALGWLNPNKQATDQIFRTMVEDVNENRRTSTEAASDASTRLRTEF